MHRTSMYYGLSIYHFLHGGDVGGVWVFCVVPAFVLSPTASRDFSGSVELSRRCDLTASVPYCSDIHSRYWYWLTTVVETALL